MKIFCTKPLFEVSWLVSGSGSKFAVVAVSLGGRDNSLLCNNCPPSLLYGVCLLQYTDLGEIFFQSEIFSTLLTC